LAAAAAAAAAEVDIDWIDIHVMVVTNPMLPNV
jgi:hypothetical protein